VEYNELRHIVQSAGFVFFDRGSYNLNLVGVRTDDDAANTFNDWMYVAFKDMTGSKICLGFKITTDPGIKYRVNPLNEKGTGIIVPGQHRGLWRTGLHKGQSAALVQRKAVPVYRDNDQDALLDHDDSTIEESFGGFNCHRASAVGTSTQVDGWSAGCQVFANCHEHAMLMAICNRAAALHGDSFTYTLLTEAQAVG